MKKTMHSNKGFTLVELAVVMVILGLITSALIGTYSLYVKKAQVTDTGNNIAEAKKAIDLYQAKFGFYPCPADPNDKEAKATDCSVPATGGVRRVAGSVPGEFVRIGVMPVFDKNGTTMLVSQSKSLDGYGRRLAYAVTERMAQNKPGFKEGDGVITVKKAGGTELTKAGSFIVLSHGPDGRGAYTPKGRLVKACDNTTKDAENCDVLNSNFIDNTNERSTAKGADKNDDFISLSTSTLITESCEDDEEVRGFNPTTGALKCVPRDLSCPTGQAFVGLDSSALPKVKARCERVNAACEGVDKVMVQLEMGKDPTCIQNLPGDCGEGYVQVGSESAATPLYGKARCVKIMDSCPENYVQVGTNQNLTPMCVKDLDTSCGVGEVQIGNNSDGTAICHSVVCPPGQFFKGIANGVPTCSLSVANSACSPGQVVTNITDGVAVCGNAPSGYSASLLAYFDSGSGCPGGWDAIAEDYWIPGPAIPVGVDSVIMSNNNYGLRVRCLSRQKYTGAATVPVEGFQGVDVLTGQHIYASTDCQPGWVLTGTYTSSESWQGSEHPSSTTTWSKYCAYPAY